MNREEIARHQFNRAPKRLADKDHLHLHYALRGGCPECGRIIRWQNGSDCVAEAECCELTIRLLAASVRVEVTDRIHNK